MRAQRVQILIKFKKYGHTSGKSNIDDVLIRDACQRKEKKTELHRVNSFPIVCLAQPYFWHYLALKQLRMCSSLHQHHQLPRVNSQLDHSLARASGTQLKKGIPIKMKTVSSVYICEINRNRLPWRLHLSINTLLRTIGSPSYLPNLCTMKKSIRVHMCYSNMKQPFQEGKIWRLFFFLLNFLCKVSQTSCLK